MTTRRGRGSGAASLRGGGGLPVGNGTSRGRGVEKEAAVAAGE
ncbi:hypothetical protein CASFOL_039069 [Castilleja foliolosa]|uniref:Histone H4 n=1 Tax=Castilleja foliolosa TaxID=1961234 RepID=A0ABD3BIU4_9LAMI